MDLPEPPPKASTPENWRDRIKQNVQQGIEDNKKNQAIVQQAKTYTVNPLLVCPHCQSKGQVMTKQVKVKKGISGGKATAAVFTAGISLVATGLSRKGMVTMAKCGYCQSKWTIA